MNWMYTKWWKWLSAILLIYVVAGSFMIPLGPGITSVNPTYLYADSVYSFEIKGFHTHFKDSIAGKVQVWFKNGNEYFCPSFVIHNNTALTARFAVSGTKNYAHSAFDVVINDELDGTFALRDAVSLVKKQETNADSPKEKTESFSNFVSCEPQVLHNKKQFASYPYREILYETIRNTFFHVPMWFVMTMLVFASLIGSIFFLIIENSKLEVAEIRNRVLARIWAWFKRNPWDILAHQSVVVALVFGACGYLTGLLWAKYTWYIGVSWGDVIRKLLLEDIKMAAALVSIFFYIAYLVLRGLLTDRIKSDRIAAVYNIFAFVIFIMCVFVIPRLTDSMHPGNGGNPAFSKYDLDNTLRIFFYPAVIGWILLGFWILSALIRLNLLEQKNET